MKYTASDGNKFAAGNIQQPTADNVSNENRFTPRLIEHG